MKWEKSATRILGLVGLMSLFLFTSSASSQDYPALKGVETVKAVFDIRSGDPQNVFEHLVLVHETFKDKALRGADREPEFAVVFMDKSVMLLSQDREGFSQDEKDMLSKTDQLMSAMVEEGVILEVCLVALDYYGVAVDSVAENIERVANGWISSIGYQGQGFGLVPVY